MLQFIKVSYRKIITLSKLSMFGKLTVWNWQNYRPLNKNYLFIVIDLPHNVHCLKCHIFHICKSSNPLHTWIRNDFHSDVWHINSYVHCTYFDSLQNNMLWIQIQIRFLLYFSIFHIRTRVVFSCEQIWNGMQINQAYTLVTPPYFATWFIVPLKLPICWSLNRIHFE